MFLRRRRVYLCLLVLALLAPGARAGAERLRTVVLPGPGYYDRGPHGERIYRLREAAADRLVIGLRPGVNALGANAPANLAAQGGGKLRKLLGRGRTLVVDLPAGSDLQAAAARYRLLPNVAFAVPDTVVYPSLVPNDPNYGQQYHLPLMQAPTAWNVTTGSASVVIAFVDSGVDLNHPDLAAKIWTNPSPGAPGSAYPNDIHGWNFAGDNNNVQPVPEAGKDNSIVSHGTLTAGIAAAIGNEGYGTAGMDWHAQIMELKVFERDGLGATASSISEAIDYAVAHGAKVINLSLGEAGFNETYSASIEAAYTANIVVVAAAGNNGLAITDTDADKESPVCNDGPNPGDNMVLGVASTNQNDYKADFSRWDRSSGRHFVDVCAPGVAIYGPVFQDSLFAAFTRFFGTNDGTSFSTPMASGLAALLLAAHPGWTAKNVIDAIRNGADNIDGLNVGYAGMLGTGRLNVARSLGVTLPPQAVHNVQAADTLGDNGGSITVTWLKSGDDGAGAKSVTKYTVLRRQGPTGSFAAVGDAPPGTQVYYDNTTTDGVPYYYQVRTVANATLYNDSTVAGPAQSRDDTPPPMVTTLQAVDRPGDSGGAIVLSWTYTPPADLQSYRLYRDAYAFTTILGRVPVYTITDKAATGYTDTSVSDGIDYYYALTAVDTAGNETALVTPAGPVQSYPNQNVTFPAGLQLAAAPALPADGHPATLLGIAPAGLRYARYDTAGAQYRYYTSEPLPAALKLALGAGFWLSLPQAIVIAPAGQSAPAGDFPVSIVNGWRLLGNPFFGAFDFGACTVTAGGNTMDLYAAQTAGLLTSVAWVYDKTAKSYRMVNGGSAGSMISPWQGFWVKGLAACTLNLTRGTTAAGSAPAAAGVSPLAARPAAAPSAKPVVQWRVRLTAQASGSSDLDNYLGVASVPQQIESPPLPGAGVELALGDSAAGPVALKYYPPNAGTITQPVTVSWSGLTGAVRVAWPEINTLPAGRDFLLKDLATGAVTNLRVTPGYVFQATSATGQRQFTLTSTPAAVGMVTVSQVSAQATAQGAQIVFVLSRSANCDIKIVNLAGRVVRQLAVGSLQPAGASTVLWDGRSDLGLRVPGGRYLVSLEARDDQGGRARTVRELALTR